MLEQPTREDLKRAGATGLACVVVALVAFSAGRFSAPVEVEERERVEVRWREREVTKATGSETKDRREDRVVYLDRVVTVEGEVREKIVERYVSAETARVEFELDAERVSEGESVREVTKTVTLRPDWRVSAQVGASLREPFVPMAGPLVVGVSAERRIVGGVSAGVWVNTVGAAGAVLSVEF